MEKEQVIILEDRGLISVTGEEAKDFLQNILSNDVAKVSDYNSIFSAIFTPQGKYLYEFFVIKSKYGYLLDCDNEFTGNIIDYLLKYKLRSKIEIQNFSSRFAIGIINLDKFQEIQNTEKKNTETILFRESLIFIDPRTKELGARILSSLEKLYLTIKKLKLKIIENKNYLNKAYLCGIPIKGTKNLQGQLFGLEANFEQFKAIDFKKGCYVGQENTARMKLKGKLRRRLMPIKTNEKLKVGSEIMFQNIKIGKVLINEPYTFALIRLFDPDWSEFKDKDVISDNKKVQILKIH